MKTKFKKTDENRINKEILTNISNFSVENLVVSDSIIDRIILADQCRELTINIVDNLEIKDEGLENVKRSLKNKYMDIQIKLIYALRQSIVHKEKLNNTNLKKVKINNDRYFDFTNKIYKAIELMDDNKIKLKFISFDETDENKINVANPKYIVIDQIYIENGIYAIYSKLINIQKILIKLIPDLCEQVNNRVILLSDETEIKFHLGLIGLFEIQYEYSEFFEQ